MLMKVNKQTGFFTHVTNGYASVLEKTMAIINFTTKPCEPHTAHKVQGKPYFCNICPCANDIVIARFEACRTFLKFLCTS